MAIATINRIESLRRKLDLTQKVMARILGVTERTVVDLEGGRELSEGISRRMTELERLERGLRKVARPESIGRWLTQTNSAFDGDSPADVIAKGKVDLLWQMIHELRSGSPS
jgi:transcriptional regulator with XRE-family HTH domain